jgi:hypothetical protein
VTGESLGLLVEEQRTNLLLYSEQFNNAYWQKNNSTITSNAAVAPDGQSTADTLVENTANSDHALVTGDFSGAANTTYTYSVYVKAAGRSFVQLVYGTSTAWGNQYANFNLTLGTVTVQIGVGSAKIDTCQNGWYRISITGTRNSNSAATYAYIFMGIASNSFSYAGDGTSGIYIWGAQLEQGAFPTSYTPTTTAAVTRAADVASITGANFSSWYNNSEGTLFANARSSGSSSNNFLAGLDSTSAFVFADILESSSSVRLSVYGTNGAFIFNYSPSTSGALAGSTRKAAIAIKSGNFGAALNGIASATGTDTTGYPTFNRLSIMSLANYGGANGTIARLTYWPARLPNPILQTLTQ